MSFWEPAGFAAMRSAFEGQFDERDGQPVYRRLGKGEAYRITHDEKAGFNAQFDAYLKRQRWVMWLWLGVPMGLGLVLALALMNSGDDLDDTTTYIGTALAVAPGLLQMILSNRRAMAAPMAVLARRAVAAPKLSRSEFSRAALLKLSWANLGLGFGAAALLSYRFDLLEGPWTPGKWVWAAMVAALVLLIAVQGVRKWQIERSA